jgi:hypothetical protein
MRRIVATLITFVLVATFGARSRAQSSSEWFDLTVPGGAATLETLGLAQDERAFAIPLLVRALYDRDSRAAALAFQLQSLRTPGDSDTGSTLTIPAPLDERTWWQILPPPSSGALFPRLVSDRNALLLAAGLTATPESVRAWLRDERDLLKFIYQNGAGAFAVVSRHLQVNDGRIVTPGGDGAEGVWQALAGESPRRREHFLRALLTKDLGRLAWYYDTIASLDQERLQAAWGARPSTESAAALYAVFRDTDPQWRVGEQPFRRSVADAWSVLTQVELANGRVVSPLSQESWALVYSTRRPHRERVQRAIHDGATPVSLPWIVREVVAAPARERRHRYELFRLAQRVFADVSKDDLPHLVSALAAAAEYRALVATLDRMQIPSAAVWASALDAARHVEDAADGVEERAAFQAVVALLERMRHVRTLDRETASRLMLSLSDSVRADRQVTRALRTWLVQTLNPALPLLARPDTFTGKTAYESTILQALAGLHSDGSAADAPVLEWEGLSYAVDLVAAEHERLRAMRTLLPVIGLDNALASGRPRDLSQALTALVYATALGDPEGPASLSPDVVLRHSFGRNTAGARADVTWMPPEERQGHGPWHVQGALLGLDLALSRLALRRIADEQMPRAPTLTLNDLGTLTRTLVTMVAAECRDADRDEIAAAIERGRARLAAAGNDVEALMALANEARLGASARQLLPWIAQRDPGAVGHLFSLNALMWLGAPALSPAELDRWGVSGDALDGRRSTLMPRPAPWEDFAGRSEAGQVTTQVPDLTLRLVEETARLRLPAMLVPALLAFAVEDYWHEVQARFADDWPQLTRQAAALSSERVQDYVAALTGGGPLRRP